MSKYMNEDVTRRVIPAMVDEVAAMTKDAIGIECLAVVYVRGDSSEIYFDYAGMSDHFAIEYMLCAAVDIENGLPVELRGEGQAAMRLLHAKREPAQRVTLGTERRG